MVALNVRSAIEEGAWIREMYDEGQKLLSQSSAVQIFDFSLGNPVFEPPHAFRKAILELIQSDRRGLHRYMPAHGLPEVRAFLAEKLSKEHSLSFTRNHLTLCVGAGGGMNIVFKTLLNPGDEVIVFKPYFPEYKNYIANSRGVMKSVDTTDTFQIDFEILEAAISERTCAVLVNSPNNPSGVVYSAEELEVLSDLLFRKSQNRKTPIYLITDEPYAKIIFDGERCPAPINFYEHTLLVTSFSKELAVPGERIGYVAISPRCFEAAEIFQALAWSQLALGFVNAPALMQRMIPMVGGACVDIAPYQVNRDLVYDLFEKLGVPCVKPKGAFFFFPKAPIADDVSFARHALSERVVLVPGRAFGVPGHVRMSFCFETELMRRSLAALAKIFSMDLHKDLADLPISLSS
jgi:aspartate aminotransferase